MLFLFNDNHVRFVLDKHAYCDFHSACALKQLSAGRHVAPHGYIILIPSSYYLMLSAYIPIILSLVSPDMGSDP